MDRAWYEVLFIVASGMSCELRHAGETGRHVGVSVRGGDGLNQNLWRMPMRSASCLSFPEIGSVTSVARAPPFALS